MATGRNAAGFTQATHDIPLPLGLQNSNREPTSRNEVCTPCYVSPDNAYLTARAQRSTEAVRNANQATAQVAVEEPINPAEIVTEQRRIVNSAVRKHRAGQELTEAEKQAVAEFDDVCTNEVLDSLFPEIRYAKMKRVAITRQSNGNYLVDNNDSVYQGYSVTTSFINDTSEPVHVAVRDGVVLTIPTTERHRLKPGNKFLDDPSFVIRRSWHFNKDQFHIVMNRLRTLKNVTGELATIRKIFFSDPAQEDKLTCEYSGMPISFDYVITRDELVQFKSLYLVNGDVTVGLASRTDADSVLHPFSPNARMLGGIPDYYWPTPGQKGGIVSAFRYVDNEGRNAPLYQRIGNCVRPIPSVTDPSVESGLYIANGANDINREFVAIGAYPEGDEEVTNQLLHYGVYLSRHEAEELGEQLMLKQAETAAQKAKQELQEARAEYEAYKLEADQQLARWKATLEERANELALKKMEYGDYYDRKGREREMYYTDRSYDRKDTNETIKTIATVVSGLVSVFALIKLVA